MPKYSILLRLSGTDQPRLARIGPSLQATIDSVLQQSNADWELVICGTQEEHLAAGPWADLRIRTALAAPEEALPWVINRLLSTLGEWVGTIGLGDRLTSDALTQLDLALANTPTAKVVFTDEESVNWFGQLSMRFNKGVLNPLRLRNQEYLRDFTVVAKAALTALGGFNRVTSTHPQHDLYLRVFEQDGPAVFVNVPHRLYQRFRDHREPLPRVSHDLQAVHEHLARENLPAEVRQLEGRAHIEYRFADHPWVAVLIVVDDDLETGRRRILRSQVGPVYRPATFQVLYLGTDVASEAQYRLLARDLKMSYRQSGADKPFALTQAAKRCDGHFVLFLEGEAVHPRWLHRLVDHARAIGTGAVGPRIFAGSRLHQPGILGHQYEGWNWDTVGRFDVLASPHQVAAVSPACLLIDLRRFIQFGFSSLYPTLYGMELCLRLDQAGFANLMVPTSRVEVAMTTLPAAESVQLRTAWNGWSDRFGLHLPLQL